MLTHIWSHVYVHTYRIPYIWAHIYVHTYIVTHILLHIYDHTCVFRTCGICRFRKGWSSLRKGSTHVKQHIQRLWRLAIDTPTSRRRDDLQRAQKRARDELQRHGFSNKRRCTLLDHARTILVRDPTAPRELLYANVIFNDLLHWELNCCDYGFNALLGVMTKDMKHECDTNASRLPMLRNPDGSSIRRFQQVTKVTYLTTARRLTLMFVWVHALGTRALMLPRVCRRPALAMLAAMQTMILASQGRRAYTTPELKRLYVDTAREYFGAVEFLMQYKEDHDTSANRTIFTPMQRGYGTDHASPETDSDGDGGTAPKLSGRGHIEFSLKGIPHGSLHFPEQLKWAGHMYMHDTSAPEAAHKFNIKKAMDRVKKDDDYKTSVSMIRWVLRVRTWGNIIQGHLGPRVVRTRRSKPGIINDESKMLSPTADVVSLFRPRSFSPLRAGGDHLMSPDARISYHEVG